MLIERLTGRGPTPYPTESQNVPRASAAPRTRDREPSPEMQSVTDDREAVSRGLVHHAPETTKPSPYGFSRGRVECVAAAWGGVAMPASNSRTTLPVARSQICTWKSWLTVRRFFPSGRSDPKTIELPARQRSVPSRVSGIMLDRPARASLISVAENVWV